MASKYWIKLYHEILDDPKMGRLPDSVWRRCIEVFLIAGEMDQDGLLPPCGDMAWRLRLTDGEMLSDLEQLAKIGIVQETDNGWLVTAFKKRQAKMSKAEYMRRLREERAGMLPESDRDSYHSVTNSNADTEEDTDIDKELELEEGGNCSFADVVKAYENEIGNITRTISQDLEYAIEDYGGEWVIDALGIAARANKRSWNYVNGILKRWKIEGKQTFSKNGTNSTVKQANDSAGGVYV